LNLAQKKVNPVT